jgi:hypothetical protein
MKRKAARSTRPLEAAVAPQLSPSPALLLPSAERLLSRRFIFPLRASSVSPSAALPWFPLLPGARLQRGHLPSLPCSPVSLPCRGRCLLRPCAPSFSAPRHGTSSPSRALLPLLCSAKSDLPPPCSHGRRSSPSSTPMRRAQLAHGALLLPWRARLGCPCPSRGPFSARSSGHGFLCAPSSLLNPLPGGVSSFPCQLSAQSQVALLAAARRALAVPSSSH